MRGIAEQRPASSCMAWGFIRQRGMNMGVGHRMSSEMNSPIIKRLLIVMRRNIPRDRATGEGICRRGANGPASPTFNRRAPGYQAQLSSLSRLKRARELLLPGAVGLVRGRWFPSWPSVLTPAGDRAGRRAAPRADGPSIQTRAPTRRPSRYPARHRPLRRRPHIPCWT